MKLLATETEACVIDRATIDSAHQSLPTMFNSTQKQTWNHHGAALVCSRGGQRAPPNPMCPPPQLEPTHTGLLTDFKKKMKKPELHPGKLVMVQVAVHSLLLKTTKGDGHALMKKTNAHKKRPYHKTISFVFSASFLKERHDQGPNSNNVCNHVDELGH